MVNRPLSLNRWNYVEGNPVNAMETGIHQTRDGNVSKGVSNEERKYNYNLGLCRDTSGF